MVLIGNCVVQGSDIHRTADGGLPFPRDDTRAWVCYPHGDAQGCGICEEAAPVFEARRQDQRLGGEWDRHARQRRCGGGERRETLKAVLTLDYIASHVFLLLYVYYVCSTDPGCFLTGPRRNIPTYLLTYLPRLSSCHYLPPQ